MKHRLNTSLQLLLKHWPGLRSGKEGIKLKLSATAWLNTVRHPRLNIIRTLLNMRNHSIYCCSFQFLIIYFLECVTDMFFFFIHKNLNAPSAGFLKYSWGNYVCVGITISLSHDYQWKHICLWHLMQNVCSTGALCARNTGILYLLWHMFTQVSCGGNIHTGSGM